MDKFFANLWLVVLVGFGVALVMMGLPEFGNAIGVQAGIFTAAFQWLHVIFGVLWIGLLYYFNFVQVPAMPAIPAEHKPGVTKHIAPSALFYFRWGAALTVLTGLILAHLYGELVDALLLRENARLIGIGMWLALIMAFNVWFIIWPAQKKVLGIVEADDAAKAKAAKAALIASRTNVLLSIPMLLAMTTFR
ncbi:MAG: urate hydroxylase PuuD [Sphingomicrobium sp.]